MGHDARSALAIGAVGTFWMAPLLASIAAATIPIGDATAWSELFNHPQLWKALALSLFTGTAALVISLALAFTLAASFYGSRHWSTVASLAGVSMALPHLAFAIGFAFLLMPAGLIARAIATIAGWTAPPQWIAVQDPLGLSLVAALVLKETPFLLWMLWSQLSRGDAARMFEGQWRVARGLGHRPSSVWTRLFLPQIAPKLLWPAVAVWVYGTSVVDMALVLGPTQPPTLAIVAWHDLNAAEVALNARGGVTSLFLTMTLLATGAVAWLARRTIAPPIRRWSTTGPSSLGNRPASSSRREPEPMGLQSRRFDRAQRRVPGFAGFAALGLFACLYALVAAVLVLMSVSAQWPFPGLLPGTFHAAAWSLLASSPSPVSNSIALALVSALFALALAIAWFESVAVHLDAAVIAMAVAALALPQIMVAGGQSALFLELGWSGSYAGMLLGHLAFVFAYVVIVLKGPYRAFDRRWRSLAHGLNAGTWRFWWRIKLPLLRAPLMVAAAVGFAVSMAQYLPSQLLGDGRITTLTTEAVTLASGGNRALTAAFALALTIPVAVVIVLAARLGRPRWEASWT